MEKKYKLLVEDRGFKANPQYHYTVVDESGNVISTRKSNREYVACTINGNCFFGRLDLIGKGDHGRQLRWCAANGEKPIPIAYK